MGPAFTRKYNTAITATTAQSIKIPMIKRGVVDFAVGADWTPASGDVKVSKDGGAAANIATLPTAITMGNAAYWEFVFSNTEMSCGTLVVTIADSATKVVEDQAFLIETFGNASALYLHDYSTDTVATVTTVTNQLTAAAIATGVWQDATGADFTTSSSIGKSLYTSGNAPGAASGLALVGSNMGTVSSVTGAVGSVTGNVGGNVVGSVASVTAGVTVTTNNDKTGYSLAVTPPTAAAIATAVWQDATGGDFTVSSSIGKSLYTTGNAPGAASGLAIVGSNMGTVSSVTGAVGSVTGGVTVTTNNDKTGYALTVTPPTAAAIATAVWQDATAGDFTTSGSIGKSLFTSGNAPGAASGLSIVGSNMGTSSSVTGAVGSVTAGVTVTTNNDKTGYSVSASGLDLVLIESGISASASLTNDAGTQLTSINIRQGVSSLLSAAAAGVLAGADTTTVTIKPAGLPAGNTRVTSTVDTYGNRSALTLKVPT